MILIWANFNAQSFIHLKLSMKCLELFFYVSTCSQQRWLILCSQLERAGVSSLPVSISMFVLNEKFPTKCLKLYIYFKYNHFRDNFERVNDQPH